MSDKTKNQKLGDPMKAIDVLEGLLLAGNNPLAQDFKRYRLKMDWPTVVGATIAAKSSPVAYNKGILYIWVVNSAWMSQLFFAKKEILKKVNEYMAGPRVKALHFTLDLKDVPKDESSTQDPQTGP